MFTKTNLEQYFAAEKTAGLTAMIIGGLAIALALVVYFALKSPFYKGFAIPMLVLGIIELSVGGVIFSRSDQQRKTLVYQMDMNPSAIVNDEMPRVEAIMKRFTAMAIAEVSILILGGFLFFYFRQKTNQHFWAGVGAGLALQALMLLVFDQVAEKRSKAYLKGLREWVVQPKKF